ncbi:MAG: hypothetical protein ACFFDN_00300 [Candidatus Hodarchaeota archaeon]
MNDFDSIERSQEREELLKKDKRLGHLRIGIGAIGIFLVLITLIYSIVMRENVSLILVVIIISTMIPVFLIDSREDKIKKQGNKISRELRSDFTKRFEILKENIKNKEKEVIKEDV